MKRGSATQRILALSLTAVIICTSAAELIPEGFSCTPDMPRRSGVYSTPPNINSVKVDLIHVFCGQISDEYGVGGFHARPGDMDPESVVTSDDILARKPANEYDYSVYKKPSIARGGVRHQACKQQCVAHCSHHGRDYADHNISS